MPTPRGKIIHLPDALRPYAGRWVAVLREQVVGQGGTPQQALNAAKALRHKETPKVIYVPTQHPLAFDPLLEHLSAALPANVSAYLVGGVVRDALLGRRTHDWDLALSGRAIPAARQVADSLGAAFYPLDDTHDAARLILPQPDGSRFFLDFTGLRGPDLESDLRARDFTINAMAVDVRQPQALLDPLSGVADLRAKKLRACAPTAFTDDPVRILRGVRQAAALRFQIVPETRMLMRQAARLLRSVSPERLRDELFRILDGPNPEACLRALDLLGALAEVLPELPRLKGVEQAAPHIFDAWDHTLGVVQKLGVVLDALRPDYDPDQAASLSLGLAVLRLGRYRQLINAHLNASLNIDRSLRPLLFLAALYHDIAKPQTRQVDELGRVRFFEHEQRGAELVSKRARALHLSNAEVERVTLIVRHHMRPLLLAQAGDAPTPRAIYRFFRDAGPAGVDICLLSLADVLATYGAALPQAEWARHLNIVRGLLEAWWEHPEESVSPPAVVNGRDLMDVFGLSPGPQIGQLLEAIREAQAIGQVDSRDEALALAKQLLEAGGK
jgi:putative nucleotidyltransferase with HDIG domain